MKPASFTRRAARAARRTGHNPIQVGQLAAHHVATQWRQRRLRTSYGELVARAPVSRLRLPPLVPPVERDWPIELRTALGALRSEAASVLAHHVDLLGSGPVELGEEIDWHRDFKSGFRWPEVFYQDVVVTRLDDDSDAKVPWELSRGHQLLALARAATVFDDQEAARELSDQLASWIVRNPPGIGINWTNAMEVGIRAVNWIWAMAALSEQHSLEEPLRSEVAHSLAVHGRHIWHNLEGSPRLRGNHYLADVVALLVIAWALPDDPLARRWTVYARRSLEREAKLQVLPDGVSFEASTAYHGLVLELLLLAWWICDLTDRRLSPKFESRVRAMLDASLALRHPDGRIPQFGDNDSGRVLPANSSRVLTHDHLLWIGAALLDTKAAPGTEPHEEVAFNFGLPKWRKALNSATANDSSPARGRSFQSAGLHVLRGRRSHVVVRCGDVGQNGNGGHSHNDLLSFELSFCGQLAVADPGTYVYTSDPGSRDEFRGTRVHSTVMVDDEEINAIEPDELFRLSQQARPLPSRLTLQRGTVELTCGHDGYRRLSPPIVVTRTFALAVDSDELSVTDELRGGGPHRVTSRLQLAPGWELNASSHDSYELRHGNKRIIVTFFGHAALGAGQGWVSRQFGARDPAPYIEIRPATPPPITFGYRIALADASGRDCTWS